MKHSLSQWWGLVRDAVMAWIDDHAPSMGAALSYYSVFSMAPLLLIVISIAGLVFGREAARNEVVGQLSGLLGTESARAVQDMLQTLSRPEDGVPSTLIGAIVLLVGASSVFGELQDALDRIWRAPARDRSGGWIGLIRSRLLSFGMILGIAFLLMVSLVLSAAISAFGKWWGGFFGDWEPLLQAGNALLGFGLTTLVFAMIYKLMPRVAVRWRDVWLGAATTSLLFTIGRFLIGLYIGKTGIASGFGAAGSLAVIFVWIYYSAQIFLLGAEFTWVYANRFGSLKASNSSGPRMAARPAPNEAERVSGRPAVAPIAAVPSIEESAESSPTAKLGLEFAMVLALRVGLPWLLGTIAQRIANKLQSSSAKRVAAARPRRALR
jgi:membrane protein